ncbi:MAG: B-type cyclin [Monoraphidium minutum]|nr:MAG: B-type cyclin [Monoraphidium minutum]
MHRFVRALGDIGNVGGITTRSMKNMDSKAAGAAVKPTALQPRAAPPAASTAAGGSSLSSLLQSRSETAASRRAGASAAPAAARAPPPAAPASPLPDIDSGDRHDPLAETGYAHGIYCYYRRVEPRFAVPRDYMAGQAEVNEKMRSILVDWLVEVHLKFKLMPETLYLTVNLIDRYLACRPVARKKLQLIGCTAMLIASKYEEIWAPEVRDFVYISDKAYSRADILACEKTMLQARTPGGGGGGRRALSYDLTVPTAFTFLGRLKKAAPSAPPPAGKLADYLCELALVDQAMLSHPPSLLAAAALHAGLASTGAAGEAAYPRPLRRHARYELAQVAPVAAALLGLARKAPGGSLKAVYKKFSSSKFGEVAKMELPGAEEAGDA